MGVYRRLKNGESIRVPSFLWGNPTYVDDLAGAIVELSEKELNGVFHVVGSSFISRYDWALKLCDLMGIDKKNVGEDREPYRNAVPRPLKSGLDTEKFRKLCRTRLHTVDEGLKLFIQEATSQSNANR
jgi:dTDP-4-dehydrorhamnose reductase